MFECPQNVSLAYLFWVTRQCRLNYLFSSLLVSEAYVLLFVSGNLFYSRPFRSRQVRCVDTSHMCANRIINFIIPNSLIELSLVESIRCERISGDFLSDLMTSFRKRPRRAALHGSSMKALMWWSAVPRPSDELFGNPLTLTSTSGRISSDAPQFRLPTGW